MTNPIQIRDYLEGDEIFRHKDNLWNITAIRELIEIDPDDYGPVIIPLTAEFIHYSQTTVGASIKRARRMPADIAGQPGVIITQQRGNQNIVLVIDGHTRAIRLWREKIRQFTVYALCEELGEALRIKNPSTAEITASFKAKELK